MGFKPCAKLLRSIGRIALITFARYNLNETNYISAL
jgi:hypothetical protein